MNAPMKMYSMRQIVRHDVSVKLPTCMYSLSNIQSDADAMMKDGDNVSPSSCIRSQATSVELISEQKNQSQEAMGTLQQRQGVILQQLEELKTQMASIRKSLQSDARPACPSTKQSQSVNKINVKTVPAEISLNANPNNPPYSLALLQRHWRHVANINIQSHTHSTVQSLPKTTQQFLHLIETNSLAVANNNTLPTITVRLIWKLIGVNQLELATPRPIQGEVNLLRYLARITSSLNYNEDDHEVDSLLDACYNICRSKTKTERVPMLQRLNKKLGKSAFIFAEFSIVDVAAYSAIRQTAAGNEINVNMTRWMKSCETV